MMELPVGHQRMRGLMILLLLVFVAVTYVAGITCPGQFLDIDGCCYHFSSNEGKKTWNDAKKACQDLGSILEKYVSLAEVKDGTCHTGALMEAITHRGKWVWLGATGVNNVWTWNTSGRSLSVKNSYWEIAQPGRNTPGDCMIGFLPGHYKRAQFGDHPCTNEYDFVCQIF